MLKETTIRKAWLQKDSLFHNMRWTFLCYSCLFCGIANAQQFIKQNTNIPTACYNTPSDGPSHDWQWSFSSCNSDITTTGPTDINSLNFSINNTNCCKTTLTGSGTLTDIYGNQFVQTCQETFRILPFINPVPATKYPGNSFNVTANYAGNNGLSCASAHGCANASISWQVNGASSSFCSGSCVNVTVPNNPTTNQITINGTYNCNGTAALGAIIVNVALNNPVINGPQAFGCGSNPSFVQSNQVTYSASSVTGAGYWNWTWPGNMSPVGPTNGQTITLAINGSGNGNVSVQAFSANGVVSSGVVNYPVSICCTPVITENAIVNSGNSPYVVEAGSTIYSTNVVQSNGNAMMHSAFIINLLPGFQALAGSKVHVYRDLCNSGYYRSGNTSEETASNQQPDHTTLNELPVSPYIMSSVKNSPSSIDKDGFDFDMMPNPNNGHVKIHLLYNKSLAEEVTVIDNFGRVLISHVISDDESYSLDLSTYPDGIYAVRIRYKGGIKSKSLVKIGN